MEVWGLQSYQDIMSLGIIKSCEIIMSLQDVVETNLPQMIIRLSSKAGIG